MSCPRTEILAFINTFLENQSIAPISDIMAFSIDKTILLKPGLSTIFSNEQLDKLGTHFYQTKKIHEKNKETDSYMITMLTYLIRMLSDTTNKYKFNYDDVCTISHTLIDPTIQPPKDDMCACLRNAEIRHEARKVDKTIMCICGLLQYRNNKPTTHTSYGDYKIKGNFSFPDVNILYDFIINSSFKDKYLFVERRTERTMAYFDFDFKADKNILSKYLPEARINELTDYIIRLICSVLGSNEYVYVDKTVGYGVHLYFPKVILTKKELVECVTNITKQLVETNILDLPESIANKLYKIVLDKQACHNGLAFMFQNKNGTHYKINKDKSTYADIPESPLEQLKLCTLRRS